MRRKLSAVAGHDAPPTRIAWWASFLATIALIAILGLARSAQAQTVFSPVSPGAVFALASASDEEPEEEEEEEAEAETSEDEEFEAEECEWAEECEEETDFEAPPECLLSSARATVTAIPNRDKVRLQVQYMASSPTAVAVDYGLHGRKGSLYLGGDKQQLARQGVLRLGKDLTEAQMAKVMAAKGFTVRIRVPAAPRYCQAVFDRQLDVRQATPTGLTWQQAE